MPVLRHAFRLTNLICCQIETRHLPPSLTGHQLAVQLDRAGRGEWYGIMVFI